MRVPCESMQVPEWRKPGPGPGRQVKSRHLLPVHPSDVSHTILGTG